MAAPEDRVQLLKNESVAQGGGVGDAEEGFPVQLDPNEDAPEVRGVFIQSTSGKDELVYITRDGSGNMLFTDVVTGVEYTLTDLLTGSSDVDAILIDDITCVAIVDDVLGNILVNQ